MATTYTSDRDFDVQVLEDAVRGHFAGKNALVGTQLQQSGAVIINDSLPAGRESLHNEITIPYFGTIGDFVANGESSAAVPVALKSTHEKATLARYSLAFEVSRWAQRSGPSDMDPYAECAAQIAMSAQRKIDELCVTEAATTPLVRDVYSASVPVYLDWDALVDSQALWGDEQDEIAGLVVHSHVEKGLRKLKDDNGRPLIVDNFANGRRVSMFGGLPVTVSDRVPLTDSSMGAVTEDGTTPPDVTLSGTPLGAWDLRIKIPVGGTRGTATFQFSTDGGNTWSASILTAASVELIDTASDSLVGMNGRTGITAAFAAGTYATDNTYRSMALLKATSLIIQRSALVFWYNRAAMSLETDKDILKHSDVAAMHLYGMAHLYRRRRNGYRPGVVAIKTNVPGYTGVIS